MLRPEGVLVDLRPQAREADLQPVGDGVTEVVASRDGSKALPDDAACEHALATVIAEGRFALESTTRFECALWWESAEE